MEPSNNPSVLPRIASVRFDVADFERVERAARVLGEREHMNISISDVIRSGAIRRAEEILAETNDLTASA